MSNEDLIFEDYRRIRESLKNIINEEMEYDNIKFWGNDVIERVKFLCLLKKKVIKERSMKNERISSTST